MSRACRIDHISDLHFGRVDEAAALGLIAALNADPADLVVASGDLTMRARSREYKAARTFLTSLKAPVLTVPGNHDITNYWPWERFLDPFGRWRQFISWDTEPMWHDDQVAVVGLNTVALAAMNLSWEGGRVGHGRLKMLLDRLAALPPNLFRVVVAHHPFLAPEDAPDTPLARRAAPALEELRRAGVRLILSGHLHRGYVRLHRGASGASDAGGAAGPQQDLLVVQAGSAISTRLRGEPNAYNRITIRDGMPLIEPRRWNGSAWVSAAAPAWPTASLGDAPEEAAP